MSSFICFRPLEVIVSGNSARLFSLDKVTFLTSKKALLFLLKTKKSNLVFSPNFTSDLIFIIFLNSFIRLFCRACNTILFVE